VPSELTGEVISLDDGEMGGRMRGGGEESEDEKTDLLW
jgi:hypothetical protein